MYFVLWWKIIQFFLVSHFLLLVSFLTNFMGISCRDLVLELLLSFLWHDLDLGLTADVELDSDWELLPGLELDGVGRG